MQAARRTQSHAVCWKPTSVSAKHIASTFRARYIPSKKPVWSRRQRCKLLLTFTELRHSSSQKLLFKITANPTTLRLTLVGYWRLRGLSKNHVQRSILVLKLLNFCVLLPYQMLCIRHDASKNRLSGYACIKGTWAICFARQFDDFQNRMIAEAYVSMPCDRFSLPVDIQVFCPGEPKFHCDLDKRRLPRSDAFFICSPQEDHRTGPEIDRRS
jgi:hypothetical protein